jgi:hypothetical protein
MKIIYSFFLLLFLLTSCNIKKELKKRAQEPAKKELSDENLLDLVQKQTFNYFWEGAEPNSALARERLHMDNIYPTTPKNTVTIGGSGFGFMAILVGIERNFITKGEAIERYHKMVDFLAKADRFHGAWPHWLNGETGKTVPFSKNDDGADLVETAFLVQGLLTVSEYFKGGSLQEQELVAKIDNLWRTVEWNFFTKNDEDILYWHWSPNCQWQKNFSIKGYNECLIMYVLAAASPTHPIKSSVYHKGWAKSGDIVSNQKLYNHDLVLNYYDQKTEPLTGPLFWAHYSYLGLNPTGLKDKYADYWKLVQNHAKIHYEYAVENPKNFKGYGEDLWGFTASYSIKGYHAHQPSDDLGVISPTAALSSFPYTPKESMKMLRNLYTNHDSLVGKYGPYDAFSLEHKWYVPRYLAIDQGPIPVMIENYRTGLLWNLFMQNTDVKKGLTKLNFKIKQ